MTLKNERISAQQRVYKFLIMLCMPGKLPSKKELRHEIRYLLKHYAGPYDVVMSPDGTDPMATQKLFRKALDVIMAPEIKTLVDKSDTRMAKSRKHTSKK